MNSFLKVKQVIKSRSKRENTKTEKKVWKFRNVAFNMPSPLEEERRETGRSYSHILSLSAYQPLYPNQQHAIASPKRRFFSNSKHAIEMINHTLLEK